MAALVAVGGLGVSLAWSEQLLAALGLGGARSPPRSAGPRPAACRRGCEAAAASARVAGDAPDRLNRRSGRGNRVQWLLGSRAHLAAYSRAGYVGFLFGGGAAGTTCARDAAKDGVTNPPPINGNTRPSADDDGGLFRSLVGAYYRAGALSLSRG